jgi:epoxyqueuosine reductase
VFAGSPIKRIGRNRLIRNVAIAAGNSGDHAMAGPLTALLEDDDETVREASQWALSVLPSAA